MALNDFARIMAAAAGGTVLADVPQTFHIYTLIKKVFILFGCLGSWMARYPSG